MKLSQYNWLVDHDNVMIAYNGFTGALAEVDENNRHYVTSLFNSNGYETIRGYDDETLNSTLLKAGYLVEDCIDELFFIEQMYLCQKYTEYANVLSVIPILDCNFLCKYCYEKSKHRARSGQVISNDVINRIVEIAERAKGESYMLYIYGGEPLLAQDKCFEIASRVKQVVEKRNASFNGYIVTNGYLLTERVSETLLSVGIKLAQVTIDGSEKTHNANRPYLNGSGTYEVILENVIRASQYISISLRVNVDSGLTYSLDELQRRIAGNINVHLYLAPVKSFCRAKDTTRDLRNRETVYSMKPSSLFRRSINAQAFGCSATCLHGVLVEPDGRIQKCWTEVGDVTDYGNILDRNYLDIVKTKKWLEWNPFRASSKCRSCKMVPTCGGGCAYEAMRNGEVDCLFTEEQYIAYIVENYIRRKQERAASKN